MTARALRRTRELGADEFPDDVVELIGYLADIPGPPRHPAANPGRGYLPEVWLLGSSLFSAELAGLLGLPYSFAYHFSPGHLDAALDLYRTSFRPSILLGEPHVMVAVSVLCAPTDDEARLLFARASALSIVQLRSGRLELFPSPEEASGYSFSPAEENLAAHALSTHLIGNSDTVVAGMLALLRRTAADELIVFNRALTPTTARTISSKLVATAWSESQESAKAS